MSISSHPGMYILTRTKVRLLPDIGAMLGPVSATRCSACSWSAAAHLQPDAQRRAADAAELEGHGRVPIALHSYHVGVNGRCVIRCDVGRELRGHWLQHLMEHRKAQLTRRPQDSSSRHTGTGSTCLACLHSVADDLMAML